MANNKKRVVIITPVYNGADFLDDCIQSVLNQSYQEFEYFIVDNCSDDETRAIAQSAAERDRRIKLITNTDHVGPIQNWNRSLLNVSAKHDYTKFVHADDWLFPQCVERMVNVFDANPTVGIVSAYRLEENRVSLDRLPSAAPTVPGEDTFTMSGRSVVSAILRERASVLGSPSAFMLRTNVMGQPDQLFSTAYLHADKDACLRMLQECDFGFIRQVLTFTRRHNESVTSLTNSLDTRRQENLLFLEKFGPGNLTDEEFRLSRKKAIDDYYRFLASKIGTGQDADFWQSHADIFAKAGSPLNRVRLACAFARRWINPGKALREMYQQIKLRKYAKSSVKTHDFLQSSRDSLEVSEKQRETV